MNNVAARLEALAAKLADLQARNAAPVRVYDADDAPPPAGAWRQNHRADLR